MKHEQAIELLNDYLDESLAAERRRELEEHIAVCPDCRRELAELRALLASAAELPASIEPKRDLWTGIEAGIGAVDIDAENIDAGDINAGDINAGDSESRESAAGRDVPAPGGGFGAGVVALLGGAARRKIAWVSLAAAAVLLLFWFAGSNTPAPTPEGAPEELADATARGGDFEPRASDAGAQVAATPGAADLGDGDAVLDFAAAGMIAAMEAECRQGELDLQARVASSTEDERKSGAVNTIVKNLKIIDNAIDEAKTAWRENPRSPHLARMVMAAYRAKASLLGKSARGTNI